MLFLLSPPTTQCYHKKTQEYLLRVQQQLQRATWARGGFTLYRQAFQKIHAAFNCFLKIWTAISKFSHWMVTENCLTDPKLCAKQNPRIAGDQSSSSAALTIVSTSVLCLSGHGQSPLELKTCSWPDNYVRSQQWRQFTSWFLVCVCIFFFNAHILLSDRL